MCTWNRSLMRDLCMIRGTRSCTSRNASCPAFLCMFSTWLVGGSPNTRRESRCEHFQQRTGSCGLAAMRQHCDVLWSLETYHCWESLSCLIWRCYWKLIQTDRKTPLVVGHSESNYLHIFSVTLPIPVTERFKRVSTAGRLLGLRVRIPVAARSKA